MFRFKCAFLLTASVLVLADVSRSSYSHAQTAPVRPPVYVAQLPPPTIVDHHSTIDFTQVTVNSLAFQTYIVTVEAGQTLNIDMYGPDASDDNTDFAAKTVCSSTVPVEKKTSCAIVFGFKPPNTAEYNETVKITTAGGKTQLDNEFDLTGTTVTSQQAAALLASASATPAQSTSAPAGPSTTVTVPVTTCTPPDRVLLPTISPSLLPPGPNAVHGAEKAAGEIASDFGVDLWGATKEAVINCFYSTNSQLAFFTQVKSIYTASSASDTISANVGSFNFNNGMQIALGTNIQAGSTNPSGAASVPVSGTPPPTLATLTSVSAAQAAQNLFFGGNFFIYDDLPLVATKSPSARWHFQNDVLAREGVDLQDFSGVNTTATSPMTHFNAFDEAYWQYDADPPSATQPVPFAVFIGGQYGYAYTSNAYARQYGFFHKTNAQVGDAAAGFLITGQFNVSVLREFGPKQKYIDSATGLTSTVDNFKSWSFSIQYQTKGLSASH